MVFGRDFQVGRQGIHLNPIVFTGRYVRGSSLREENPNAIDSLTSSATEHMFAGSYHTITQTYTVSETISYFLFLSYCPSTGASHAVPSANSTFCSTGRTLFVPSGALNAVA